MRRRLTTILAADVVGYSRLMRADEAGTLAALKAHLSELFDAKAHQYHGRIIKLMGDGVLMEFASVVDATCFAVEVQCATRERNAQVPEEEQILFRIGINAGDIIVEGDDIYGDGVNIASRLENLAEPGGICVHRDVRNQIRDKLDLAVEDQGEVEVKNIARPIRAFKISLDDKARRLVTPVVAPPQHRARRLPVAVAAASLVALLGGLAWWLPWTFDSAPASVGRRS